MVAGLFDEHDFVEILRSRFERDDVEFVKEQWVNFSQDVEGFLGEHYVLNLDYKIEKLEGTESFFIKTLPRKVEFQGEITKEFNIYEKEIFLYSFILGEFRKAGYDTTFAPRCFYCKDNDTIVLENLKEKNFRCIERGKFFDEDHFRMSLDALAMYHGNTIAYEEKMSKELGREYRIIEEKPSAFKEVFFIANDVDGTGAKYIKSSKECIEALLPLLDEPEGWKRKLLEKVERFDCATVFHQDLPSRKSCCHGDLWSNNLMFQYSNKAPTKCCLLDFQLVRHHHPVYDALLVAYSNTTRDFRQKHLDRFINYYHESLGGVLKSHGLSPGKIFPKDDFMATARALEPVALFQGFAVRTFVFLPKQVTNDVIDNGSEALKGFLFSERPSLLYNHCLQNKDLKKIFLDDLYDFYHYFD